MAAEQIGNFRIVGRLGIGGMGEVFLGEHEKIGTRVAIKMLQPHISANTEHVQRFFNEAIAVSKIQHSGIAKIFDVGFQAEGRAYLVMEFLDGETLAARIRRMRALPIPMVGDVGKQIASVLEAVHKAGITHRDLKPDNIFLVPDSELASGERVKILDFGIAKLSGHSGGLTATAAGSMGTPAYMSPEQWKNSKTVDWRADAYSLGCLAFEMVTGRPPFVVETIGEACAKHLTEEPSRASAFAKVPAALDALLARLLAKDASQRPATMKEIGQSFAALTQVSDGQREAVLHAGAPLSTAAAIAVTVPPTGIALPAAAQGPASPPALSTTTLSAAVGVQAAPTATGRRSTKLVAALSAVSVAALAVSIGLWVARDTSPSVAAAAPVSRPPPTANTPAPPTASPPAASPPAQPTDPANTAPPATTVATPSATIAATPTPPPPPAETIVAKSAAATKPIRKKPARAPVTVAEAPAPVQGGCDEVSCVLNNYEGACCAKYKKSANVAAVDPPRPAGSDRFDVLDRAMIAAGIAAVKGRVASCGDRYADAKGVVKVKVTVDSGGNVAAVSIVTTPHVELATCVVAAVERARFPRTQAGGSFSYPFAF